MPKWGQGVTKGYTVKHMRRNPGKIVSNVARTLKNVLAIPKGGRPKYR